MCLRITMLGTGAAAHPLRGHSSVLVEAGSRLVLVDAGCSAPSMLARIGVGPDELDIVLLTHFHADHACGYPAMLFGASYVLDRVDTLTIVPPGEGERAASLARAIRGGAPIEPRIMELRSAVRLGDVAIEPVPATHGVPAQGYLISHAGLSILVTGDTMPNNYMEKAARGADLVVHEATYPSHMEEKARQRMHSTVSQAIAESSGVDTIILYHLTIESEAEAVKVALEGSRLIIPQDGMRVTFC